MRKMKKGEVLLKTLEFLEGAAVDAFDLFCAIMEAGYGASVRGIEFQALKRKRERGRRKWEEEQEAVLRRRYAKFLYNLRHDGLIAEEKRERKKLVTLTKQGFTKLLKLKKQIKQTEILPDKTHISKESNVFTIIAFDIPETERRKRDWLREVLKNLGFKMIQKSVWIGKIKIPRTLLDDLVSMRIITFVEIFEISKRGTLEQIT